MPFYFNDAGNQPMEPCTQRHGARNYRREEIRQNWGGGGVVGRIGGGANLLSYRQFVTMAGGTAEGLPRDVGDPFTPIPPASPDNDLWIGPRWK